MLKIISWGFWKAILLLLCVPCQFKLELKKDTRLFSPPQYVYFLSFLSFSFFLFRATRKIAGVVFKNAVSLGKKKDPKEHPWFGIDEKLRDNMKLMLWKGLHSNVRFEKNERNLNDYSTKLILFLEWQRMGLVLSSPRLLSWSSLWGCGKI